MTTTLGAPQRRCCGGRRTARRRPPSPPCRHRARDARRRAPFDGEARRRALARAAGEDEIDEALAVLNRVLHRSAPPPPTRRARGRPRQALVARVGYGEGEEVAHGRWTEAHDLPPPAPATPPRRGAAPAGAPRRAARRPRRAAGRRGARAARAADLDAGRRREAALQLRIALEAALAELEPWREQRWRAARRAARGRAAVGAAAPTGAAGRPRGRRRRRGRARPDRLEAALRARAAARIRLTVHPTGGRSRRSGGCTAPMPGVVCRAPGH